MGIKFKRNHLQKAMLLGAFTLTAAGCIDEVDKPVQPEIVNVAPTIATEAVETIEALTAYSYTFAATDSNSDDVVTLSATVLPAWLTFDAATGILSGTPSSDDVGANPVTLVASDGTLESSQSFDIMVTVALTGSQWSMVWSDEFDGSTLNSDNWNIETGDGSQYGLTGWGNNELEWYSADNITVADGNLVITAKEEASNGYNYTSGRMRSDTKVDIKYGRIEAKIKTPVGQGLWSAFWMLPTDSQYGGWASGGEIDIMEVVSAGADNNETHGTLHYGMAWPLNVSAGENADIIDIDAFHEYAIEWEQDEIRWYIDGTHYGTVNSDSWWSYYYAGLDKGYISAPAAPFNQDFHLLLNLAVGGNWPGSPNADTVFDAEMLVDYVRVYECDSGEATGVGCANNINSTVEAPAADAVYTANYSLFSEEGASSLSWEIVGETVVRELQAVVAWDNGGAIILEQMAGEGGRANVLDINTTDMGNVAINAVDGKSITLFGMGNNPNSWELGAGELKFEIYIDSALTPADSSISFKMDSGYPKLGSKTLAVEDLPKDTWTTVSIPVNDLIATSDEQPLDTSAIVNLFVVEFSAAAHIQLDNIELICGHKEQNGCGINAPAVEIETEIVEVFTDSVNEAIWTNGIGAWDNSTNDDYYDGDTSNHVNWSMVDTGEEGHDTVVEVNFLADGTDGVFYFQSAQSVDLSALNAGSLFFDVRVTDYGSNTKGLTYKVDCTDPCSTGDQTLGVVGDGVWETITIPVADLIAAGLDTTKVNTGLVLFPVWGDQQGVTFQVDNVRWEKTGTEPAPGPEPEPLPADSIAIYTDSVNSNFALWDCCGGATVAEVVDEDTTYGNVAEVVFGGTATVAGFLGTDTVNADLTNGTLEFDLKMMSAPLNSDAVWLLKIEGATSSTFAEVSLSSSNEGAEPTLDTWQHFTFDLSALTAAGMDFTQLKIIMVFPSWGEANGASYRIDNVIISGE